MTRGLRRIILAFACIFLIACPLLAQGLKPVCDSHAAPAAVTDDATRLVQLGQLYMGQNNPDYALQPVKLDLKVRNDAGDQAQRIFQQVTTRYPKFSDGWLWLGIVLTETLHYSKKVPEGEPVKSPERIADGMRAFRTAYECKPDDIVNVIYYGEALMAYSEDFDGARKLWSDYLKTAKTDMQRVMALTQSARACLNKAYFGKITKKIAARDAQQLFADAESFVKRAAKICPQAPDVKKMQALLDQYRTTICSK